MSLQVTRVVSAADLRAFLAVPRTIYRGDPCFVPPLLRDVRTSVAAADLEASDTRALFLARDGRTLGGRVVASIDPVLNARKGERAAHLSLFECVEDREAAAGLFEAATGWLRARRIRLVRGPVSPAGPALDEYKGLLVDGFDRPPVLLTSYNPRYYEGLFEASGFTKDIDVYAYRLDRDALFACDPVRALDYAARRYGYRVETFDLHEVDRAIGDIKHVLDLAVPAEWPDMVAPEIAEIRAMAARLLRLADRDLLLVARAGGEAVAFGISLPDYNQVLIHLNGLMTPLAAARALWYRRRITAIRFFVMFVVPAFRNKGVSHAIYHETFRRGTAKGYTWGEGSTIGETNTAMRQDIEKIGGRRYKTYRVYRKELA